MVFDSVMGWRGKIWPRDSREKGFDRVFKT